MVLYLISPYLGGGKIGLLWDMAIIGAKIPQLAMNANSSYTTMLAKPAPKGLEMLGLPEGVETGAEIFIILFVIILIASYYRHIPQ